MHEEDLEFEAAAEPATVLPLVGKFTSLTDRLLQGGLESVAALDRDVRKLIEAHAADPVGVRWAALKAIDIAEGKLKERADTISRLRGHLEQLKKTLRAEAGELLAAEPEQKVARAEFSASLVTTVTLEGPKNALEWPERFQKKVQTIEADKAGALALLKAGEVFEGLRLVKTTSIRFT